MPGVRRPKLAVEADRRARELRVRIGTQITTLRDRRAWTRSELAHRAGLGRMAESRIERGVANPDLESLQRIAMAPGRPLVVSFGGRDPDEAPRDAAHLAIQELVLTVGRAAGYDGRFEVATRPAEPWRSADVGLRSSSAHRLIHVECWNTIGDVGAAARSSARKGAELADLAVARWGLDAATGLVSVVRATARNRALVARHPEVFASRFPGSSKGWVDALSVGTPPPREPGLVWCDPGATRLFAWTRHGG